MVLEVLFHLRIVLDIVLPLNVVLRSQELLSLLGRGVKFLACSADVDARLLQVGKQLDKWRTYVVGNALSRTVLDCTVGPVPHLRTSRRWRDES